MYNQRKAPQLLSKHDDLREIYFGTKKKNEGYERELLRRVILLCDAGCLPKDGISRRKEADTDHDGAEGEQIERMESVAEEENAH